MTAGLIDFLERNMLMFMEWPLILEKRENAPP
jgi:hypothetical protein